MMGLVGEMASCPGRLCSQAQGAGGGLLLHLLPLASSLAIRTGQVLPLVTAHLWGPFLSS